METKIIMDYFLNKLNDFIGEVNNVITDIEKDNNDVSRFEEIYTFKNMLCDASNVREIEAEKREENIKKVSLVDMTKKINEYIDCNEYEHNFSYGRSITQLRELLNDIEKQKIKEENEFYDKQYEKFEKWIYNASDKELEEHYNWYNVEKGDKEDLINTMFESYCDTYSGKELEERCNMLLEKEEE